MVLRCARHRPGGLGAHRSRHASVVPHWRRFGTGCVGCGHRARRGGHIPRLRCRELRQQRHRHVHRLRVRRAAPRWRPVPASPSEPVGTHRGDHQPLPRQSGLDRSAQLAHQDLLRAEHAVLASAFHRPHRGDHPRPHLALLDLPTAAQCAAARQGGGLDRSVPVSAGRDHPPLHRAALRRRVDAILQERQAHQVALRYQHDVGADRHHRPGDRAHGCAVRAVPTHSFRSRPSSSPAPTGCSPRSSPACSVSSPPRC